MFLRIYKALLKHRGHQGWWPGETDFEICVGAILTQNTAWSNVEKAISNLKKTGLLTHKKMKMCSKSNLSSLIKPSGYFNQKAEYLHEFCKFLDSNTITSLKKRKLHKVRELLLNVKGIGEETADSMMLYALEHPVFVIDAYTKRIYSRLGLVDSNIKYGELQTLFHKNIKKDVELYKDYHAQLVILGKDHCKKRPDCTKCPLKIEKLCRYVQL